MPLLKGLCLCHPRLYLQGMLGNLGLLISEKFPCAGSQYFPGAHKCHYLYHSNFGVGNRLPHPNYTCSTFHGALHWLGSRDKNKYYQS